MSLLLSPQPGPAVRFLPAAAAVAALLITAKLLGMVAKVRRK
jgi:hypothetical protein